MKKKTISYAAIAVILILILSACGSLPAFSTTQLSQKAQATSTPVPAQPVIDQVQQATATPAANQSNQQPSAPVVSASNGAFTGYEEALENIYSQVGPSVVNIHVVVSTSTGSSDLTNPFGFPFGLPNLPSQGTSEALGSGFIWDTEGHIVTNNHVISDATSIDVTFADGTNVPAKVVGTDPSSDLAVIQVQADSSLLKPVSMGDSKSLKVGQVAVAIGNPFGLQGTMTVGIISALGRSISASDGSTTASGYSIPNIIQTDAAINPGNSGGVLLNLQGQVIGVTAAIESSTNSNAGIGFAIPSATVKNEVPVLIQSGHFDHPYLGISGTDLTTALAQAMNLPANTRGALIVDVVSGGPADKAGLKGSSTQTTINGNATQVGGDIVIAIDGQPIKRMDDLIAYLNDNTKVGQKITVTILRDGQQKNVEVTLGARPTSNASLGSTAPNSGQQGETSQAYLGIQGYDVNSAVIQAMNLPTETQGVLVEKVQPGSPAEQAGLQGGTKTVTINGQSVTIGGDIILAIGGQAVTGVSDLQNALSQLQPGQRVRLTILRNGQTGTVRVTLGQAPAQSTQ